MVFSSPTFLFAFLPLSLIVIWVAPERLRNLVLLLVSLLFYAWGEQLYTLLMLASIAVSYLAGLCMRRLESAWSKRVVLTLAIVANLSALGWFKYARFALESLGASPETLSATSIHLPLGISFFTFHVLSYLIDLERGRFQAQSDPVKLGLYIALFPQLIAGPIIRYAEIAGQLGQRSVRLEDFAEGARRFTIGLAKKVLIANTLADPADRIFALPENALGVELVWFGALCFALQIYFDFSGYSDMAIGLGRILGFRFPENFDLPYSARSVGEFWRRWHISLSRWFKDYVYTPLGGNRVGAARTYANLIAVFLLCGLWHGASWTFVVWGAFHGFFLVVERAGLRRLLDRAPASVAHLYCLLVVLSSWVIFRADTLSDALTMLRVGAGLGPTPVSSPLLADFSTPWVIAVGVAACLCSARWNAARAWLRARVSWSHDARSGAWLGTALSSLGMVALLYASASRLAAETYRPFIYFQF